MNRVLNGFFQCLYPSKKSCLLCGHKDSAPLCKLCASSIEFIHERKCLKCGKGLSDSYIDNICPDCKETNFSFHSAYSCFYYRGGGKELIHKLKYEGKKEGAKVLAKYMAEVIHEENLKADVIVPVPIHESKMDIRGFNQSAIIGEHLSAYVSLPVWDCLIRIRDTKDQYDLNKHERKINLIDAFSVNMLYNVRNKDILLIDDVFTTGSTANECSKELIKSGAGKIYVVTAAAGANT